MRRGGFRHLPIESASVDVAVACSSLGARPPRGGDAELAEMLRILRSGGICAVIWPGEIAWFTARGMTHAALPAPLARRFRDVDRARHLRRLFYGEAAAAWVVRHGLAVVPYFLGTGGTRARRHVRDAPRDVDAALRWASRTWKDRPGSANRVGKGLNAFRLRRAEDHFVPRRLVALHAGDR